MKFDEIKLGKSNFRFLVNENKMKIPLVQGVLEKATDPRNPAHDK